MQKNIEQLIMNTFNDKELTVTPYPLLVHQQFVQEFWLESMFLAVNQK